MKKLFFLMVVISLTACTSTAPHKYVADPDKKWQQRKTELSKIRDWILNGRVAIVNGQESWFLTMNWQYHNGKYILDLSGPLGVGHTQLTGTDEGVVLVDADKNNFYADSPDRLLKEVAGMQMPVESLLYWIRGLPNRDIKEEKQHIDKYGRLSQLQQDGWRVRFKRYINVDKNELPQKIFIDGYKLKVKIFVDEWDLKSKTFTVENEEG